MTTTESRYKKNLHTWEYRVQYKLPECISILNETLKISFFQYHNFFFEGYSYTAKSHPIILVLAKETMINAISKISDIEGLWCNISFLCMFGRLRRYNQLCFTVKKILEEACSGTICPLARGKWWEPNRLTSIAHRRLAFRRKVYLVNNNILIIVL